MSISNTNRVAGPFTGTGVIAPYAFTFKVFQASDLVATVTDTSGVESLWTNPTNYTLTLNPDQDTAPGGTLTPVVALPTGYLLTLTSAVANLQPVVLTNAGAFLPAVINTALDRLTILVQQLAATLSRAITFPISDGIINFQLPTKVLRAGKLLGFDLTGAPVVSNLTLAQIEAAATGGATTNVFYSASTGGTGDAVAATAGLGSAGYLPGQEFRVVMSAANTITNPTINFDGKGAKNIKQIVSTGKSVLTGAGSYYSGYIARFIYDGTDMILVNPYLLYAGMASVNTGADLTGTDSINTYGQVDAYQPQSAMGVVGASSVPGVSASTSRGTGVLPIINNSLDLIGGITMYMYTGAVAAYTAGAAVVARAVGATANNLGAQLEFYTKLDNGLLTLAGLINNVGQVVFGGSGGTNPTLAGKLSVYGTAAEGTAGQRLRIGRSTTVDYMIQRNDSTGTLEIDGSQTGSIGYKILNGSLAIGPTDAVASALLDMQSTTKGLLPPRMTTTQKNAISSPATGLIVFDTTLGSYFYYTGSVWSALGSSSYELVGSVSALGAANVSFTGLSSTYRKYIVEFTNVFGSANDQFMMMRTSANNGSSYDSGASDYGWSAARNIAGASFNAESSNTDTKIPVMSQAATNGWGTSTGQSVSGTVEIYAPADASKCKVKVRSTLWNQANAHCSWEGGGARASNAAVNAIQFFPSGGTITGEFRLYGIRNA